MLWFYLTEVILLMASVCAGLYAFNKLNTVLKLLLVWCFVFGITSIYYMFTRSSNNHIQNIVFLLHNGIVFTIFHHLLRNTWQRMLNVFGLLLYLAMWLHNLWENGIHVYASNAWSVWCVWQMAGCLLVMIKLIRGEDESYAKQYSLLFFGMMLTAVCFGPMYLIMKYLVSEQPLSLFKYLMYFVGMPISLLHLVLTFLAFYSLSAHIPLFEKRKSFTAHE